MANYVGWRVLQVSLELMHLEIRNIFLKFQKTALGKEDLDQRWKFCALLTQNQAAVATGAMYVEGYFKENDKKVALELVDNLYKEYLTTIANSDWMNEQTKISAQNTAMEMKKYIGYEDELRREEGNNYYNDLYQYPEDKFLEMVLAFKIFETDREYKHIYINKNKTRDWSKYSRPATINAYYKSEDNSIRKLLIDTQVMF